MHVESYTYRTLYHDNTITLASYLPTYIIMYYKFTLNNDNDDDLQVVDI